MKKTLLLGLLLLFCFELAFSQTWRRVGSWGNELTDIHWVNEDEAFISGDRIILKTIDGGLSWVEQEPPLKNRMLALDFHDQSKGLMVGENGLIFRTENGGQDWEVIDLPTENTLTTVEYLTENRIVITGNEGIVFRSEDGGLTWNNMGSTTSSDWNGSYFVNADTGYVVTSQAEIFRTENAGSNWELLTTVPGQPLNDIYFTNDSTGYAVGNAGTVLKTINGGLDWTFLQSGTNKDYHRVAFSRVDPQIGLIGGKEGTMLRTTNGGLTFSAITSRTTQDISGISFKLSGTQVYSVARSGVLISSTNSGASWSLRMSGREFDFHDTQFTGETRGYLVGEQALVYLTTNGGNSFTDRSRPLSVDFFTLDFVTAAFGYVAGEDGAILNTTNSGGSWTALNPGTEKDIYGLHFFNADKGYIVGEGGYMAQTENRGVNWTTVTEGTSGWDYKDIDFFNLDTGLVVGTQGVVYRTFGENEWNPISIGSTADFERMAILDDSTAIVIGSKGALFKTVDWGNSWEQVNMATDLDLRAVEFLDESVGFVAGEKGFMAQTFDKGETWEVIPTGTFQDFSGISFGDLNTGYAVGENGTFYQYSCLVPLQPSTIFGEDDICLSQQIYSVQDDLEPGVSFEWRVDGGTILEGQGTNRIVVRWETPGRNAVLVRGQNECGNGATTALEVLVSTEPQQISEIVGEGVACQDRFQPYSVDSVDGTEYIWEATGGVIQEGQGLAEVLVEWTTLGEQVLRVRPRNPCGAGALFEKAVLVGATPEQPEEINGSVRVGLTEENYEVPEVSGVNYQWDTDGGGSVIDGQGTAQVRIRWEQEGDFVLTVTPMNECDEGEFRSLEVNVNLITSVGGESQDGELKIYPNPSQGNVRIEANGMAEIQEISVVNSLGQTIRQLVPDVGVYNFDIKELPKGMHLVIIRTRTGKIVKKLWVN